jgi:hypothetical protein
LDDDLAAIMVKDVAASIGSELALTGGGLGKLAYSPEKLRPFCHYKPSVAVDDDLALTVIAARGRKGDDGYLTGLGFGEHVAEGFPLLGHVQKDVERAVRPSELVGVIDAVENLNVRAGRGVETVHGLTETVGRGNGDEPGIDALPAERAED